MITMPATPPKKVNYLNNRDILKEIHKSKMSYSYLEEERYSIPDIIILDIDEINYATIQEAKKKRASRLAYDSHAAAQKISEAKLKPKDFAIDPESIDPLDLVIRVCTFEHIPEAPGRKKNPKSEKERKAKLNFPPFKQFVLTTLPEFKEIKSVETQDHVEYEMTKPAELREVARSHWKGNLETGEFSVDHGRFTPKLGTMILKIVEKYSQRGNWRGYSYVDEMRGQAILGLSAVALQFNEFKSDNPFSYWTSCMHGSFVNVLNGEKNTQRLRDDLLIESGSLPSYGRQLDHEEATRLSRDMVEDSDD